MNDAQADVFRTTYQYDYLISCETEYCYRSEFKKPQEQKRNSELDKFILRKDVFEKDQKALEEYREK